MGDTSSKISIWDVAKYIFIKGREKNSDGRVSHMKLHKLLWFCQGWYSAMTGGELLFKEDFYAWKHGPVSFDLYFEWEEKKFLTKEDFDFELADADENRIPPETREKIDVILKHYLKYTASKLRQLSHGCRPWIENYRKPDDEKLIPQSEIIEYFKEYVKN